MFRPKSVGLSVIEDRIGHVARVGAMTVKAHLVEVQSDGGTSARGEFAFVAAQAIRSSSAPFRARWTCSGSTSSSTIRWLFHARRIRGPTLA